MGESGDLNPPPYDINYQPMPLSAPSAYPAQQPQQMVVVTDNQAPLGSVPLVQSYTSHIILACFTFWFCGVVFGLIAFILAGNAVITIAIRLRSDYDVSRAPTSIRRDATRAKNEHDNFSYSRIVVVSQSNRITHIVISITFVVVECVVVSSYRIS